MNGAVVGVGPEWFADVAELVPMGFELFDRSAVVLYRGCHPQVILSGHYLSLASHELIERT